MVPDMAAAEELEGAWEPADLAAFADGYGYGFKLGLYRSPTPLPLV